jgi:4'-phosphopantetheinyl transferase
MKTPDAAKGKIRMPGSPPAQPLTSSLRCLRPVVLSVPATIQKLPARPKVAILSRLARVAVRLSARLSGVGPPAFAKDDRGVPQPSAGIYWSITHKPEYVAGVVAARPVGIDIERMRPPAEGLYPRIATPAEWRLAPQAEHTRLFHRVWTAKEAVLKAEGIGLRGLSRCRVTAIPDHEKMRLDFDQRPWTICHHYLPTHVLALTRVAAKIHWAIDPGWPRRPEQVQAFRV